MNVSHPITCLTPARTARVLEVLAGTTRPLTGREIQRISGEGSIGGAWNTLQRLEKEGLLSVERRGNATYYAANRNHMAWPSIEALVRLRATLLGRLAGAIVQWAIRPLHASVFGSTARGDGDTSSDIDLLIVRPDDLDAEGVRVWEDQVGLLRDTVRGWTGNRCQTLVIDRTRLGEHVTARDPLVASWLRDGILLCGAPIQDIAEIPFTQGVYE